MQIEMTIRNALKELPRVAAQLDQLALAQQLAKGALWPMNVALDEVLSNIIFHAYEDAGEHEIRLRVGVVDGFVVAEVEDDGRWFDPLAAPVPDLDASPGEPREGGLGIHLVRSLMGEVRYARDAGRNRLTMKRKIASEGGEYRMDIRESSVEGIAVLEVSGRIDSATAASFEARLVAALAAAHDRLVLDLGELQYLSSAGFRVLYRCAVQVGERGGRFVLCSLSATVKELVTIAGFQRLLSVARSRADAVSAVRAE